MTWDGDKSSFFQRVLRSLILSTALKAITFTLTTLLTRRITPAVRGTIFFVDLYADTVAFLSREALRGTALRSCTIDPEDAAAAVTSPPRNKRLVAECSVMFNIAAWAVPLSVALVLLFESAFLLVGRWSPLPSLTSYCDVARSSDRATASALPHVVLFALGLVVQSIAEGKVCLAQACGAYSVKVKAESVALGCRLVFLLGASYAFDDSVEAQPLRWCVAAFVVYSVAFLAAVEWAWWRAATSSAADSEGNRSSAWEHAISSLGSRCSADAATKASWLGYGLVRPRCMIVQWLAHGAVWWQLFSETVLRLVLTEGEKFALAALGSLSVQGSYDTVMNLGSLVARLIFRLWEESCFAKWSTIMSSSDVSLHNTSRDHPIAATNDRACDTVQQRQQHACCLAEATSLLYMMLRLAVQVSLPLAIFGPPLSRFALHLLYAGRWSGDEPCALLSRLCYALPLMAVNGLLEAFIRATLRPPSLVRAKYALLLMSAIYVSLCFAVMHTGRGVVGVMECLLCTCAVRCLVSWTLVAKERRQVLADNEEGVSLQRSDRTSLMSMDGAKGTVVSLPFLAMSSAIAVAMRLVVSDRANPVEWQNARSLLSASEFAVTVVLVAAYCTCAIVLDAHDGLLKRAYSASRRHLASRIHRGKRKED